MQMVQQSNIDDLTCVQKDFGNLQPVSFLVFQRARRVHKKWLLVEAVIFTRVACADESWLSMY